jgi:2-phosphosulfolactate phosphatase
MNKTQKKIEVCYTPESFQHFETGKSIAVVVDIFRATSSIVTAFMNGVNKIIPVGTLEEAKKYKKKGYVVAAERDGVIREFADFGNSPENFTPEAIEGKEVAYSTTNGTRVYKIAAACPKVVTGAFLNISALSNWLVKQQMDVIILCAGWKNKFNLEDAVFAGALTEKLLKNNFFYTICDSALSSVDIWNAAKKDLVNYFEKSANRNRLHRLGLDGCIPYCCTMDQTNIIPVLENHYLVKMENNAKRKVELS